VPFDPDALRFSVESTVARDEKGFEIDPPGAWYAGDLLRLDELRLRRHGDLEQRSRAVAPGASFDVSVEVMDEPAGRS
jgi:hypothetical protein